MYLMYLNFSQETEATSKPKLPPKLPPRKPVYYSITEDVETEPEIKVCVLKGCIFSALECFCECYFRSRHLNRATPLNSEYVTVKFPQP